MVERTGTEQGEVGVPGGEDSLAKGELRALGEEGVGVESFGVEQEVFGFGAPQGAVQPADQFGGRDAAQAEGGEQGVAVGIEVGTVVLGELLLLIGDLGGQFGVGGVGIEEDVVVPAGEADQRLQRLVQAVGDQACLALGPGVEDRAVGAPEVGAAGVVAGDRRERPPDASRTGST
ncbi:hypothetical protein [Kitasatospora sp. NPDC090091]|uniref:hypothetical protein n=1 Tax=Kitasatospora sp. NPDC090091 TaxID=3364081 RepID=UPI0037F9C9C6